MTASSYLHTELVKASQRELATVPVAANVSATIEILTRIESLQALSHGIARGVEQFTSLKPVHFRVLQALNNDITHPRHIGRRLGMDAGAITLTLEILETKGLVFIAERIGDRVIEAGLTEAGHAALSQAEAVQLRAIDALLARSETQDAAQLLSLLEQAQALAQSIMNTIATTEFDITEQPL